MRPSIPWFLLVAALCTTAHAAAIPDYPFVYVRGEAQARVPPDVADVSFTVLAEGSDATLAVQTVESRVKEILEILHSADVRDNRIDASGLTKEAVTTDDSEGKPIVIRGYRVSRQFSARIVGLKNWPDIATHLLELQNVTDLQVTFGRSDARDIEVTLLDKAAKDAQEQARRLAMSFGQHAGPVMALSQLQFSDIGPTFGMGSEEGGSVAAPEAMMVTGERRDSALFIPHSIELSVEVYALVKLQ
ncbi:MAG: SIMPL domain-containing protein [Steroidobacteraceae bacterium]